MYACLKKDIDHKHYDHAPEGAQQQHPQQKGRGHGGKNMIGPEVKYHGAYEGYDTVFRIVHADAGNKAQAFEQGHQHQRKEHGIDDDHHHPLAKVVRGHACKAGGREVIQYEGHHRGHKYRVEEVRDNVCKCLEYGRVGARHHFIARLLLCVFHSIC